MFPLSESLLSTTNPYKQKKQTHKQKKQTRICLLFTHPHSHMRTSMAKSAEDLSSKKQFQWTTKISNEDNADRDAEKDKSKMPEPPLKPVEVSTFKTLLTTIEEDKKENDKSAASAHAATRKKLQAIAVSRLRFVLRTLGRKQAGLAQGRLGSQVVGTLFGYRRGHMQLAFQKHSRAPPVLLVELATPITGLVREMASGLVRIALECDKGEEKKETRLLLEEPMWRTYCNGKKCGFTTRRECGLKELQILKNLEPVSMGAGVLPGVGDGGEGGSDSDGEIMYMRANFERVVGSRDSEAFYMMNPDSNGAPELSIYLLRV